MNNKAYSSDEMAFAFKKMQLLPKGYDKDIIKMAQNRAKDKFGFGIQWYAVFLEKWPAFFKTIKYMQKEDCFCNAGYSIGLIIARGNKELISNAYGWNESLVTRIDAFEKILCLQDDGIGQLNKKILEKKFSEKATDATIYLVEKFIGVAESSARSSLSSTKHSEPDYYERKAVYEDVKANGAMIKDEIKHAKKCALDNSHCPMEELRHVDGIPALDNILNRSELNSSYLLEYKQRYLAQAFNQWYSEYNDYNDCSKKDSETDTYFRLFENPNALPYVL